MRDMKIIFPRVRPILLIHDARLQITDKMLPQAGEMPQPLRHVLPRLLLFPIQGQIRVHLHWLPRQHPVLLPLVDQLKRLLNRHPTRRIAAHQLAHRLHSLGMRPHRQFQPFHYVQFLL